MLSDKEKEELAKVITSKVKTFECPMCHNHSFTIIDGYLIQNLQNSINSYVIGNEPIIPSIAIVCNNCGFMSQHNLGILGMLNKKLDESK